MLVFMDESGDPILKKIGEGSSRYFVMVCVIFNDDDEAERTAGALKKLKSELRFTEKTEFKFNGSNPHVRKRFLETTVSYSYRIRAVVVDKTLINSKELKNSKDSFYNYFIKLILKHNNGTLSKAKIRLDGSGNRLFRKNLSSYLKKELNSGKNRIVENLRMVDSHSNILIQMADMVAGSIRRSYEKGKTDQFDYRKIIKNKIEDCWEFR